MKNLHEVVRLKELEMSRLEMEIEALRIAAPLLAEEGDVAHDKTPASARSNPPLPIQVPEAVNAKPQPISHAAEWKDRVQGRS